MPDKWKKMPKGWTDESRRKFWNSLTGKVKHKVTKCIKEMDGKVDDPGAFCASLADRVEGKGWRSEKKAAESPRPGCILCVKKHLGQAAVLFQEALQGYPAHRWLAIGHLAEAEAESQELDAGFSTLLRDERKKAEVGDYIPDCTDLLMKCGELDGSEMGPVVARVASRFMQADDRRYYLMPGETSTFRYIIEENGIFHRGTVGIKRGETYIKFVVVPTAKQGKYRMLAEKGKIKQVDKGRFVAAIEDETYMTNIDIKRLYHG